MLCSQEDNQGQCGRCGFVGPLVHFLILPFFKVPGDIAREISCNHY